MILVPQNRKCRATSGRTVDAAKSNFCNVSSVAGNLGHRHGFAGKHALIDDAIATQQQAVAWELREIGVGNLIDIAGGRGRLRRCIARIRSAARARHIRSGRSRGAASWLLSSQSASWRCCQRT